MLEAELVILKANCENVQPAVLSFLRECDELSEVSIALKKVEGELKDAHSQISRVAHTLTQVEDLLEEEQLDRDLRDHRQHLGQYRAAKESELDEARARQASSNRAESDSDHGASKESLATLRNDDDGGNEESLQSAGESHA